MKYISIKKQPTSKSNNCVKFSGSREKKKRLHQSDTEQKILKKKSLFRHFLMLNS